MVLGQIFKEEVGTSSGTVKTRCLAVEPVQDVAILGALDNQTFYDEVEEFEDFCENTKPVTLCRARREMDVTQH